MIRVVSLFVLTSISVCVSSSAGYGQRYLSEFVGRSTLKSSFATATLPANLVFDVQNNRRVRGVVSIARSTGLTDSHLADGTLAQSGNCNVQLQSNISTGGLNLIEIPFDAQSFALVGKVGFTYATDSVLAKGKYTGGMAVLLPVFDPVRTSNANIASIGIRSSVTGATSVHGLDISKTDDTMVVQGQMSNSGGLAGYNFTLSASPRWVYLVGENGSSFIVIRAPVTLTLSGELDGFVGEYRVVNASGKELDFGTVEAF